MINLSKGPWNKPPFLAYYSEPKPIKLLCEDIPAPEKVLAYAATMKFSHYQLVLKDEKGLSRAVALKVLQEFIKNPGNFAQFLALNFAYFKTKRHEKLENELTLALRTIQRGNSLYAAMQLANLSSEASNIYLVFLKVILLHFLLGEDEQGISEVPSLEQYISQATDINKPIEMRMLKCIAETAEVSLSYSEFSEGQVFERFKLVYPHSDPFFVLEGPLYCLVLHRETESLRVEKGREFVAALLESQGVISPTLSAAAESKPAQTHEGESEEGPPKAVPSPKKVDKAVCAQCKVNSLNLAINPMFCISCIKNNPKRLEQQLYDIREEIESHNTQQPFPSKLKRRDVFDFPSTTSQQPNFFDFPNYDPNSLTQSSPFVDIEASKTSFEKPKEPRSRREQLAPLPNRTVPRPKQVEPKSETQLAIISQQCLSKPQPIKRLSRMKVSTKPVQRGTGFSSLQQTKSHTFLPKLPVVMKLTCKQCKRQFEHVKEFLYCRKTCQDVDLNRMTRLSKVLPEDERKQLLIEMRKLEKKGFYPS